MLDFLFPKNEVSGTFADLVVLRCFLRWTWVWIARVCSATGVVATQASPHMNLAQAGSPTAGFFASQYLCCRLKCAVVVFQSHRNNVALSKPPLLWPLRRGYPAAGGLPSLSGELYFACYISPKMQLLGNNYQPFFLLILQADLSLSGHREPAKVSISIG